MASRVLKPLWPDWESLKLSNSWRVPSCQMDGSFVSSPTLKLRRLLYRSSTLRRTACRPGRELSSILRPPPSKTVVANPTNARLCSSPPRGPDTQGLEQRSNRSNDRGYPCRPRPERSCRLRRFLPLRDRF